MNQHLGFLAAIRERPRSDTPRLIYADWLEEQGNPRGAFIRAQCRAARLATWSPRRYEADAEAHDLLLAHEEEWLGPLLGHVSNWEFRRGMLEWVTVKAEDFLAHAERWLPALPLMGVHFRKAHGHLAALAACPQLQYLDGRYLGDNDLTDADVRQLVRSPHLGNVTALYLQGNRLGSEGVHHLGTAKTLPRLRELNLGLVRLREGGTREITEGPALKRLRHLTLSMSPYDKTGVRDLAGSELLGSLRTLIVLGTMLPPGSLALLAESPRFAGLRRLGWDLNEADDSDLRRLAESPHARNLTALSISSNDGLTDVGLLALARSPNLKRLRSLDVGPCRCGRAGLRALGQSKTLESLRHLDLSIDEDAEEFRCDFLRGRLVRGLHDLSLDGEALGPKDFAALTSGREPLRLRRCRMPLAGVSAAAWDKALAAGKFRRLTELSASGLTSGHLDAMLPKGRLPGLRRLSLYGLPGDAAEVRRFLESPLLRRLHHLTLDPHDDRAGRELVRGLTAAAGSELRSLTLGWSLTPDDVRALTDSPVWPKLTRLRLGSFAIKATGVAALAAWPQLRNLRWLTLRNSSSDAIPNLEALARSPHAGPLLRIDLENSHAPREVLPLLRERFGGRFSMGRPLPRVVTMGNWARVFGEED